MDKQTVLVHILVALESISKYAREMKGEKEEEVDKKIKAEAKHLIKEAHMLGLSGQVCPTCRGTGRV